MNNETNDKYSPWAKLSKSRFYERQWCDVHTGEWFSSAMNTKEDAYRLLPNPAARGLFDLNCLEGDSVQKSLIRVLKQIAALYDSE
jgi:hypothetical protein